MRLDRRRGDTKPIYCEVVDGNRAANIAGWTDFKLTVNSEKEPQNRTNEQFQLIGTIINSSAGFVKFQPDASDTDLIGTYYYDIEAKDDDGNVITLVDTSEIVFRQDITK